MNRADATFDNWEIYWPHHVIIKPWLPQGQTASGIILEHDDKIPRIFGHVVRCGKVARTEGVEEGNLVVYPRYAGEVWDFNSVDYYVLNVHDIEAAMGEDVDGGVAI